MLPLHCKRSNKLIDTSNWKFVDEVQNAKRKTQNVGTALLIIIRVHEVNISHACIYRTRQRISQIRKDLYRCKIENFAIPINYNL